MKMFSRRYQGVPVLVTGDTGFKGSWLAWWLHRLGADVTGAALPPEHAEGPFVAAALQRLIRHIDMDVRNERAVARLVRRARPRIVFHLAAQPLVRRSYRDPVETMATNILGTAHVLEAVRAAGRPCAVVVVTSDKCYENPENLRPHRETDRMGGSDPYSVSKGCAELVVESYRRSFFSGPGGVLVASARAGNVIGPGDWAEDRIVPDGVRALRKRRPIVVRRPSSVRPWQHVLEPLSGYLWLGARLLEPRGEDFAEAWNFGPRPARPWTVAELVERMVEAWGTGSWRAAEQAGPHEARYLRLSIEKARRRLGWRPVLDVAEAVDWTVAGYRTMIAARGDAGRTRGAMDREIERYAAAARSKGAAWAKR